MMLRDCGRHGLVALGFALVVLITIATKARANGLWEERQEVGRSIAIVVDASFSYEARQTEALAFAMTLIDSVAEAKLRRWEPDADRVAVISLDAMPQILWQGSLRELKESDREAWVARFLARADYTYCTDVGAAFNLATRALAGDPQYVHKYLFAFTDLVDEPPTTSMRKCAPRAFPSLPPDDFPWAELENVSVSVFWLPADQKLAWSREVEKRGLGDTFAMYTESESDQVEVIPPPRPTKEISRDEQDAKREIIVGAVVGLVKKLGIGLALLVASLLLLWVAALLRRRHGRRTAAPVLSRIPATMPRTSAPQRPPTPRPDGRGR